MVKMFLVSFAEKTFNYLPKSESHLQSSFYLVLIRFNMSTHTIKIWIEEISSTFITNKLHNQKYYIIIDVKKNKKKLEFCYIESLCCIGSTLSFFFFSDYYYYFYFILFIYLAIWVIINQFVISLVAQGKEDSLCGQCFKTLSVGHWRPSAHKKGRDINRLLWLTWEHEMLTVMMTTDDTLRDQPRASDWNHHATSADWISGELRGGSNLPWPWQWLHFSAKEMEIWFTCSSWWTPFNNTMHTDTITLRVRHTRAHALNSMCSWVRLTFCKTWQIFHNQRTGPIHEFCGALGKIMKMKTYLIYHLNESIEPLKHKWILPLILPTSPY